MARKFFAASALAFFVSFASTQTMAGAEINVNADTWLGNYKLDNKQLDRITKAVENALNAPIDSEEQCGKVQLDCVVRAAKEWTVDGSKFREIVIVLHGVGHTSHAIGQSGGAWPKIVAK